MEIRLETVLGSAEVGLFALPTDRYVILSKEINPSKVRVFQQVLKVDTILTSLADSILVAPFAAGNSNGLLLSKLVVDEELKKIKAALPDLNIHRLDTKYTAVGNLILCNDRGAVVSSLLGKNVAKVVADVLGTETVSSTVANRSYVGSLVAATNVGALVFVDAEDDELKLVEDVLHVNVDTGTVNGGVLFPRSGIAANSSGAIVGALTTGPELMTISRVFQR
ncbi:translation initiation factor eIF-6 [Candidatus Caldarchaeum subterraneum]|uniref:Translation initiation factor 6 n=1 Tax=Caldiarchaeum subterraneum TaxID=311458 RepID=E6N5L2_CALS0|nr:translation initiation factor eIF-6 [Candidatus Caldarchaeum subterraneum]BAJ50373.1 translation initiation factor eIF-6 [Candidatus Caldarchaeum subterraneum]